MSTVYYTATSLDGFIADEHDSLDWLFALEGDESQTSYPEFITRVGAIAMGSTTYEWILREHVEKDAARPQPWAYEQPTWVFSSRQLRPVEGADLRFTSGDVAPVHAEMTEAAAGKDVWVVGGGDLAGQFHDAGLLDEVVVTIGSATLGAGAPLLPRRILPPRLELRSVTQYGPGFAELSYAVRPSDSA